MSWNRIEFEVLDKYMSEPKDSEAYQSFWTDILADYSADYWKLARKVPFKVDTIGYQLMGRVVDERDDIKHIDYVRFNNIDDIDTVQIGYVSPFGHYVYIPIEWFEDREAFLKKWVRDANEWYIAEIERDLITMRKHIEKKEKELEYIKNIDVIDFVFGEG